MYLQYNGVPLNLIDILRVDRTAIWTPDQTELLYTEWGLSVVCVYAPGIPGIVLSDLGGTAVNQIKTLGDLPQSNPIGTAPTVLTPAQCNQFGVTSMHGGAVGLLTDREILPRLLIPRRQLVIWGYARDPAGANNANATANVAYWLVSPRPQQIANPDGTTTWIAAPRDAKNGPIVQAIPVTTMIGGGQAFGVQLEIRTWVTPCPFGSDRLVLAHRWQMQHDHDDDNYLTRTITGEIHFNGGVKDYWQQRPDLYRNQFFHPIPLGFKRQLGPIVRSSDGLVIRYAYTDTDQKVVFDPGASGATRVEIREHAQYLTSHMNATAAVKGILGAIFGAFGGGDKGGKGFGK